ncbi:MAG: VCBS domain-containing protein, partial [Rhizobiaceae bacterium]|nr:VCBS domain-containing protein [Rhizobiaceae bacterium]
MAKLKKIKLNNKDNDFVGGNKAEKILGNGGNDTIDGGKGNDKLYGGGGKDTLISKAGEGNDLLDGGKGKDTAVIGGNFADAVITETAKGFKIQIDGRTITTKSIETFQFDDRTLTKAQMKNDAPTADATQDVSGNEDASITGTVVGADVDGDTLTYSITGAATNGNVTIDAATGEFTYTPNGDYNGADSFVVTIDDGRGGTTTQTVNVTVDPVNDAAVIGGDDAAAITEGDAPITGTLTIADVDGAAEEAFTAETVAGAYGDLEIDAAGNWTYTLGAGAEALAAGEEATDTITVT